VAQGELPVVGHAYAFTGVYVFDARISKGRYDFPSIILTEIIAHDNIQISILLLYYRAQTVVQRIRPFARWNNHIDFNTFTHSHPLLIMIYTIQTPKNF
jgi:hypothetical protein